MRVRELLMHKHPAGAWLVLANDIAGRPIIMLHCMIMICRLLNADLANGTKAQIETCTAAEADFCDCQNITLHYLYYRIAGNFGGKNIWRIALIMAFSGFYFGSRVSLIP